MSNLAGGTLTPQSPQCPGRACQLNDSRDGLPQGDEFEGSGGSATDKPEHKNPDVNIPPSAHETEDTIESPQLADRFSVVANDACARQCVQHLCANKESKIIEGVWQFSGNAEVPGEREPP